MSNLNPLVRTFTGSQRLENIEDYIRWRGDLSFADSPLNLLDSMVFCQLSYVDYTSVLKQDDEKGITLSTAGKKIKELGTYRLCNLYGGHEDFFEQVCASRRFGKVLLRRYCDIFDESSDAQFSAVEFAMGNHESFIAFRGTDNSIVGWKEDFMISFTRIRSQEFAKDYLGKVMHLGRKYYIGGHSKGGNLAMFAAAWLTPARLKQVKRIYDLDGPGFCPERFDRTRLEPLLPLTTKIIPEFCMIGKIFELQVPDTHIVKSTAMGVDQHDLMSWLIDGLELQAAVENDKISDWLDRTIAEWVADATFEERQTFVNEFFGALAAGGATTMQEVTGKGLLDVVKAMASASPTSRKLVAELATVAVMGGRREQAQ